MSGSQKLPFVAHLEGKVTVAVSTPRLSCRTAGKARVFTPVGSASGRRRLASESRSVEDDMKRCRYWFRIAGLWLLTLPAASAVHAQAGNYPDKPVTVISDAAAGSTPDVDARFVAEGLGKAWGKQVVVINHPGANGSIAARVASEVAPDGYTLFMPALSTFVALLTVAPNLPLKLPRDFVPIGFTAENPMFIAVNPTLGITTSESSICIRIMHALDWPRALSDQPGGTQ
jgi:hypothetical protein